MLNVRNNLSVKLHTCRPANLLLTRGTQIKSKDIWGCP